MQMDYREGMGTQDPKCSRVNLQHKSAVGYSGGPHTGQTQEPRMGAGVGVTTAQDTGLNLTKPYRDSFETASDTTSSVLCPGPPLPLWLFLISFSAEVQVPKGFPG